MSTMFGSALNPSLAARSVVKRAGQVSTIARMRASGTIFTRAAAASPPTVRSAAIISRTLVVSPGRFSERSSSQSLSGVSWAWMNAATAARGDVIHSAVSGSTGQSDSSPASGSRMMPLANYEAAAFGFPGRTTTVGTRSARPSM